MPILPKGIEYALSDGGIRDKVQNIRFYSDETPENGEVKPVGPAVSVTSSDFEYDENTNRLYLKKGISHDFTEAVTILGIYFYQLDSQFTQIWNIPTNTIEVPSDGGRVYFDPEENDVWISLE